jgi:hypothetical protein
MYFVSNRKNTCADILAHNEKEFDKNNIIKHPTEELYAVEVDDKNFYAKDLELYDEVEWL